jgi:hypothetical protein
LFKIITDALLLPCNGSATQIREALAKQEKPKNNN